MQTRIAFFLALFVCPALRAEEVNLYGNYIATTEPLSPAEEHASFRLPPGFEIQLVASEPQIHKPMNLGFDTRGRLWVTDVVEYPFPVEAGEKGRDRVSILEDTDADGTADRITRFVEGLNNPIGLLPIHGGAIIFSIPRIEKFLDHDGDDRADERIRLYGEFDIHDTHGLVNSFTLGFDGWVYACHSFGNNSRKITGTGDWSIDVISGNTIRFRPDGTRLEFHAHGQVNPFGLCVDNFGNLYSADCHTRPAYLLLREGYYPRFGAPHDGMGFGPEILDHPHSSTGIAGIVYYAAEQFPSEFRDRVYTGNPVTNRIESDRMVRHGATYVGHHEEDFLTSTDPWFRPVDLKLGPDGAIYVADFYNRIIGHWEVPLTHPGRDRHRGRIWRIVYRGAPQAKRATNLAHAEVPRLLEVLGSQNLTLRRSATQELVERVGSAAVEPLRDLLQASMSQESRAPTSAESSRVVQGLWALERFGALDDALIAAAASHFDSRVRVHALTLLGERLRLSETQRRLVVESMNDPDGLVQKAAVTALMDHPRPDQVRLLIDQLGRLPQSDTFLRHATRLALRSQLRLPSSWSVLAAETPRQEDEAAILDVILGVHSPESAAYLLARLRTHRTPQDQTQTYIRYIARYLDDNQLPQLLAWLENRAGSASELIAVLTTFGQALRERSIEPWAELRTRVMEIAEQSMASPDKAAVSRGLELTRNFSIAELSATVREIAIDTQRDEGLRGSAYEALFRIDPGGAVEPLKQLLLDGNASIKLRMRATDLLGSLRRRSAYEILAAALKDVPFRIGRRITGTLTNSREGGELFVAELVAGRASPRLLLSRDIQPRLERFGLKLDDVLPPLIADLPDPVAEFEKLVVARRASYAKSTPDLTRGAEVFKKNCAACHRIGEDGGLAAPQLSGIGVRGRDRVLEDVLDPNRNIDPSFRASLIVLNSGVSYTGLVKKVPGPVLVLVNSAGEEIRIPRDEIAASELLTSSPMPANFSETIPEPEFNHLLGYLLMQRAESP